MGVHGKGTIQEDQGRPVPRNSGESLSNIRWLRRKYIKEWPNELEYDHGTGGWGVFYKSRGQNGLLFLLFCSSTGSQVPSYQLLYSKVHPPESNAIFSSNSGFFWKRQSEIFISQNFHPSHPHSFITPYPAVLLTHHSAPICLSK